MSQRSVFINAEHLSYELEVNWVFIYVLKHFIVLEIHPP